MWFQTGPPLHNLHCDVLHGHCTFLPHPSRPLRRPVRPDRQNAPLHGSSNSHQSRQQPKQPGTPAGDLIYFPVPTNQIPPRWWRCWSQLWQSLPHSGFPGAVSWSTTPWPPSTAGRASSWTSGTWCSPRPASISTGNMPTAQALWSAKYFQCNQSNPLQRTLYEVPARVSANPLLRPTGQWCTKLFSSSHPICVRCHSITPQVVNDPNCEIMSFFLFHSVSLPFSFQNKWDRWQWCNESPSKVCIFGQMLCFGVWYGSHLSVSTIFNLVQLQLLEEWGSTPIHSARSNPASSHTTCPVPHQSQFARNLPNSFGHTF